MLTWLVWQPDGSIDTTVTTPEGVKDSETRWEYDGKAFGPMETRLDGAHGPIGKFNPKDPLQQRRMVLTVQQAILRRASSVGA